MTKHGYEILIYICHTFHYILRERDLKYSALIREPKVNTNL